MASITNSQDISLEAFFKGITVLKFGRSGRPQERVIYLSQKPPGRYLYWHSPIYSWKIGKRCEIDLHKTVTGDSLRKGQTTVQFQRHEKKYGEANVIKKSLSIMYMHNGELRSLDISVAHQQVFKYIYSCLQHIISHADCLRKTLSPERLFFKTKFEDADTDRSGSISKSEIMAMLPTMNIQKDKDTKRKIKELFDKTDKDNSGGLDYIEFCKFMEDLRRRDDLEVIWGKLVSGKQMVEVDKIDLDGTSRDVNQELPSETFPLDKFLEFWNKAQKERLSRVDMKKLLLEAEKGEVVSEEDAKKAMSNKLSEEVTYPIFRALMTSASNDAYDTSLTDMTNQLDLPLSDYYIASSHNTYLEGDQLWSKSSVGRYVHDLNIGCRCVELDCWDGDHGEPIVYHGYTATGKIKFKDVILVIKRTAFINSPYPIILSIENHCSIEQQGIMAAMLVEILGALIQEPTLQMRSLPSPDKLKGKIIIKGKRLDALHAVSPNDDEDQGNDRLDDFGHDGVRQLRPSKPKTNKQPPKNKAPEKSNNKLHQGLANITFLAGAKLATLERRDSDRMGVDNICSFSENKVMKFISDPSTTQQLIDHNKTHLSRIYPSGLRTNSSNYDPTLGWLGGSQCVALNYQTGDICMQLNMGKFRSSHNSGYIMKPMRMLSNKGRETAQRKHAEKRVKMWGDIFWGPACANAYPVKIIVHIISGQSLPKPNGAVKGEVIDPYVELIVNGEDRDRQKANTSAQQNNGFNPIWDEVFELKISQPDVAMLTFRCMDEDYDFDDFIASSSIPVPLLRPGYRNIQLYDTFGMKSGVFQFASLFVHINIEPLSKS
jgi:phosphatidylinositol phospholipase C, delta